VNESLFREFRELEAAHWWFQARRQILLAILQRHLPLGSSLLDVGCGTGFFLMEAQRLYDVWGLDPSPIALGMCRERGLDQVLSGAADDMSSVAEREFDAVTFLDVIEHVDDDVGALRNAHALLRRDGLAIVTVPAYQFLWSAHDVVNQHRRRYRRSALRKLFSDNGFEVVQASYFNSWLFPLALVERLGRRMLKRSDEAHLTLPSPRVNRAFERAFLGERDHLVGGGSFPAGLSILIIAQAKKTAVPTITLKPMELVLESKLAESNLAAPTEV
jgi:SAM-dependent methyltransferase